MFVFGVSQISFVMLHNLIDLIVKFYYLGLLFFTFFFEALDLFKIVVSFLLHCFDFGFVLLVLLAEVDDLLLQFQHLLFIESRDFFD